MKLVQIGSNKGNDDLTNYLKKKYKTLEFALFVEANSLHIDELKKCYSDFGSNVFVENIAIKLPDHKEKILKFYYHPNDGPNFHVTSCKKSHVQIYYPEHEILEFEVPCLTIEQLFEKYSVTDLDWILLDIEGIDAEILLTTDWKKYNINRIEYEKLHLGSKKEEIENRFRELGYIKTVALHHYDDAWIKFNGEQKMEVTLYAIAKNEENNIDKFIENSKKFSHTVVVDTGSTDNTVQLLKDAGIEVYEHPQTDEEFDFSIARNQALSYVKTDWAFSLDFNESVDEFFPQGLDVISNEFTAFRHERYDNKSDEEEPVKSNEVHVRFHRTKNYIWVNAVHEIPSFLPTESHLNESVVDTTIKITKKVQKSISKELFYLSICEREYEKNKKNWYYIWFIFNHYFSVKNLEKALNYGQEFLNQSSPYFNQFRVDCFITCSQIFLMQNNIQSAANYAFHAVSEAMNIGGFSMNKAFLYLLEIGKILDNPNIIIFASGFSEQTLNCKERFESIEKLYLNLNVELEK